MQLPTDESFRQLLCDLGNRIRDAVVEARSTGSNRALSAVARVSAADTIYEIDRFGEEAIFAWLEKHWPSEQPVRLVMEGLEEGEPCVFPSRTTSPARWVLILDPIDGTRGIMYDKRSAWSLAGLARVEGDKDPTLADIHIAAMTEIPTTKQWRADQISCVSGNGLVCQSRDLIRQQTLPLELHPSQASDFAHSFSSLVKFFPAGRTLTAQIEELLWERLLPLKQGDSPMIFDDQYISTGGQFYELLCGHDRLCGDLRPAIHAVLELENDLVCHPYDACVWPLLKEGGVVFEEPMGGFPDAPLDTTSPVCWIAYANPMLARQARPVLQKILREILG